MISCIFILNFNLSLSLLLDKTYSRDDTKFHSLFYTKNHMMLMVHILLGNICIRHLWLIVIIYEILLTLYYHILLFKTYHRDQHKIFHVILKILALASRSFHQNCHLLAIQSWKIYFLINSLLEIVNILIRKSSYSRNF